MAMRSRGAAGLTGLHREGEGFARCFLDRALYVRMLGQIAMQGRAVSGPGVGGGRSWITSDMSSYLSSSGRCLYLVPLVPGVAGPQGGLFPTYVYVYLFASWFEVARHPAGRGRGRYLRSPYLRTYVRACVQELRAACVR